MTEQSAPIETIAAPVDVPAWIGTNVDAPRRRPADQPWPVLRAGIDLVSLITALAITGAVVPFGLTSPWAPLMVVLSLVAFGAGNLYAPRPQLAIGLELRRAVTLVALVSLAVAAPAILATDQLGIGDGSVVNWLVASTLIVTGRLALYGAQRATTARLGGSPTLIVGAGEIGHRMATRLDEDRSLGLTPIGFLDKEPLRADVGDLPLPVLGASWDLERVVADHGIQTVVVAFSTAPSAVMVDLVRRCWKLGVDVRVVPRLFEVEGRRTRTEHLG